MPVLDDFRPLQGAVAQAESWTKYLNARHDDQGSRRPEEIATCAESIVWIGVHLGESLPFTWRLTFDNLLRRGSPAWQTVKDFEAIRQAVRALFFTAREAMDSTRRTAEALQAHDGREHEGMDRLLKAIEDAHMLEESVFRDWPSFKEPTLSPDPIDSLPVDESLAHALGIAVEEARQKMDARRRELNAKGE
jgi:hypothetical protein